MYPPNPNHFGGSLWAASSLPFGHHLRKRHWKKDVPVVEVRTSNKFPTKTVDVSNLRQLHEFGTTPNLNDVYIHQPSTKNPQDHELAELHDIHHIHDPLFFAVTRFKSISWMRAPSRSKVMSLRDTLNPLMGWDGPGEAWDGHTGHSIQSLLKHQKNSYMIRSFLPWPDSNLYLECARPQGAKWCRFVTHSTPRSCGIQLCQTWLWVTVKTIYQEEPQFWNGWKKQKMMQAVCIRRLDMAQPTLFWKHLAQCQLTVHEAARTWRRCHVWTSTCDRRAWHQQKPTWCEYVFETNNLLGKNQCSQNRLHGAATNTSFEEFATTWKNVDFPEQQQPYDECKDEKCKQKTLTSDYLCWFYFDHSQINVEGPKYVHWF